MIPLTTSTVGLTMSNTISKRAAQVQATLQAERGQLAGALREANAISAADFHAFVDAVDVSAQLRNAESLVGALRRSLPARRDEYAVAISRSGDARKEAKSWAQAQRIADQGADLVKVLKEENAFRAFDDAARQAGESGLIPLSLARRLREGVIRSAPALELASLRDTAHRAGRGNEYDALVRAGLDYCDVQRLKLTEMLADGIVPGLAEAAAFAGVLTAVGTGLLRKLSDPDGVDFGVVVLGAASASAVMAHKDHAQHAGAAALRDALDPPQSRPRGTVP